MWLPRGAAVRRALLWRAPSHYTFSQHVSGCDKAAHHVSKMLYTLKTAHVEYELLETFMNGKAFHARAKLFLVGDTHYMEESVSADGTAVQYSAQLDNQDPVTYHGPTLHVTSLLTPAMQSLLDAHLL